MWCSLRPPALGAIRAYVGEPGSETPPTGSSWSYPRVRGRAWSTATGKARRLGPPARARQSRVPARLPYPAQESICAGAAEPFLVAPRPAQARVHPRGRGRAIEIPDSAGSRLGPSARARQSRRNHEVLRRKERSIRAGAAEPAQPGAWQPASAVHPRGRGRAMHHRGDYANVPGPSARARQSQTGYRLAHETCRSIRAGAAEPPA